MPPFCSKPDLLRETDFVINMTNPNTRSRLQSSQDMTTNGINLSTTRGADVITGNKQRKQRSKAKSNYSLSMKKLNKDVSSKLHANLMQFLPS